MSTPAARSWEWIRSQLGTGTRVTTASTITPSEQYDVTWTGPVAGTFAMRGVSAPVGGVVPGHYDGLEVRAIVVTDTAYLIGTTPARADNTFAFADSRPGAKMFRLVDSASNGVLAEWAPTTGLVRSFDVPAGDPLSGRTFAYDQALALLTALSLGDAPTARVLATGLLRLQTTGGTHDGAFVASAAAVNPAAGLPEYRTGIHSIAAYAVLRYLAALPPNDASRASVVDAAGRAVGWLLARQVPSGMMAGLVTGGYGAYLPDGRFDPTVAIPWASTEHNLDAWHTLSLAQSVVGDAAAGATADLLGASIVGRLWDANARHFLQGWTPEGPDRAEALDVNSWGAIFLRAVGEPALAKSALDHTARFSSVAPPVTGYGPQPPHGDPLVWFEGSAGVALAQYRLRETSAATRTLAGLRAARIPNGAWPAATRADPAWGMTAAPAVAATAWMLLAAQAIAGVPAIWDEQPMKEPSLDEL